MARLYRIVVFIASDYYRIVCNNKIGVFDSTQYQVGSTLRSGSFRVPTLKFFTSKLRGGIRPVNIYCPSYFS